MTKIVTVKVFITLLALLIGLLAQMNIYNAFLSGNIVEEVYMSLPLGYMVPNF